MQFGMLFDAPAQPESRRERPKPAPRPAENPPAASGQIALILAAPQPAPEPTTESEPKPVAAPAVVLPPAARREPGNFRAAAASPLRPMRYVVQAFNRGRLGLIAEPAIAARDAAMACHRAETLAQRKAGVIAYAVPADMGEDDYPEARILARFGQCPETDD